MIEQNNSGGQMWKWQGDKNIHVKYSVFVLVRQCQQLKQVEPVHGTEILTE